MPRHNLVRAFVGLWWTLGGVLFVLSIQTVWHGLTAGGDAHAVVLGSIEAIAAVLFLVPRTLRTGGAGLLATFVVAFVLHAARGQLASPLLVYAAGVVFVMVHGPVPPRAYRGDPMHSI